jgi:hypothetical protein
VFFNGNQFLFYDIAADRAEAPKSIPPGWLGSTSQPQPHDAPPDSDPPTSDSGLSPRRRRVIDELLPGVVPCQYNDKRFQKMSFGLTKSSPGVTPGYTTCGSLPMYVARMLKDMSIGGTNGVRTAGIKKNAWVVADGEKRPRPGDLYALLNKGDSDRLNSGISHVGVIIDASGDQWKTADAGQGDGWAADYVTRKYDAEAGTLTGEIVTGANVRPPRVLAGWIDLDEYPFPAGQ